MDSSRFGLALLLAVSASACATTSGQAWLDTPIEQTREASTDVYIAAEPSTEARPRLRHTITLGESYAATETRAATAASPGSQVNVNVATYVPVTVNTYAGGFVDSPRAAPSTPSSSSSTPATGGDFPAPPSYGPSFPYHTSPASPWSR